MSIESWLRGVGSAAQGDYYHHFIEHAVINGKTMCGLVVHGEQWKRERGYPNLKIEPQTKHPFYEDVLQCQRCAKAIVKVEHD